MPPIPEVDISSPAFKADPYPYFARLRDEAPAHRVRISKKQTAWLVTRYDDVASVLKDQRFAKDRRRALTPDQKKSQPWVPGVVRPLQTNMLDVDEADHTRLRGLVQKAFTPSRVEALRPRIEALADQLLDKALRRPSFDLIADYALPLPTTIIAEMLGVPDGDRGRFNRWSNAVVTAGQSTWGTLSAIPHILAFLRYIRKLIETRRKDPGDDLTSALVAAEESGDQLTGDEMISMIFLLLIAGHETTVNLIGNGTLALLKHPDAMADLRDDPSMIRGAVEELLRFDSPVMTGTERFALDGASVAGVEIPRGEVVFAVIASANRDPAQFELPDTLNLARDPNRHLAFGLGVHFCLGAGLARLEGQVAIGTLLRRAAGLRMVNPHTPPRWRKGLVLRGMESLPVRNAS